MELVIVAEPTLRTLLAARLGVTGSSKEHSAILAILGHRGGLGSKGRKCVYHTVQTLRRRGYIGPVVWASFQGFKIPVKNKVDAEVASIRLGNDVGLDFVFDYDLPLELPCSLEGLRNVLVGLKIDPNRGHVAKEAADRAAREMQLASLDHQIKGFEAMLRLIRAAQIENRLTKREIDSLLARIQGLCNDEHLRNLLDARRQLLVGGSVNSESIKKLPPHAEILMVDDQYASNGWEPTLQALLGPGGYRLRFHDGSSGSTNIKGVDLVLLDLNLPNRSTANTPVGMEGLTIAHEMLEADPHLPIIFFTAHESLAFERQRIRLGAPGYFVKNETGDAREASEYLHRFLGLLENALHMRFRGLLRSDLENGPQNSVILQHRLISRLARGLDDIEDPQDMCYDAGQAIDWAYRKECEIRGVESFDSDLHLVKAAQAEKLGLSDKWDPWLKAARKYRNRVSHMSGADTTITQLDAHLSAAVAVLSIRSLDESPSSYVGLFRLALILCGRELHEANDKWMRRVGERMLKECEYVGVENSTFIKRLETFNRRAIFSVANCLNCGDSLNMTDALDAIDTAFPQEIKGGVTKPSVQPSIVFDKLVRDCLDFEKSVDCAAHEVLFLLALTRSMMWCDGFHTNNNTIVVDDESESDPIDHLTDRVVVEDTVLPQKDEAPEGNFEKVKGKKEASDLLREISFFPMAFMSQTETARKQRGIKPSDKDAPIFTMILSHIWSMQEERTADLSETAKKVIALHDQLDKGYLKRADLDKLHKISSL